MLAQFYAPIVGGEERMTESLAVGLAARGHDVAVATLLHPGQAAFERRDGVRVHRLPGLAQRIGALFGERDRRHAPPAPDPETTLALRRLVDRERPDVVHGHNWLDHAYLPLHRGRRAAYVVSLHDYGLVCANKRLIHRGAPCGGPGPRRCLDCATDQYGTLTGPPVALLTAVSGRAQRRAADLFLPVSHEVAARCGLIGGTTPYEVIPNFLLHAPPHAAADDPRLGDLPGGEFILYVGDLTADKGVDVLLEAHAGMSTPVPLVLIGRPLDRGLARPRASVTALGSLPHRAVLAAWRRCAVGVLPSVTPETFGLSALEAMAAGAPVVASRAGGLPDLVADGESGMLVAPGDVRGLRDALERLAADPGLRGRLAAGARARARRFSAATVLPRFEAAYARALAARRSREPAR